MIRGVIIIGVALFTPILAAANESARFVGILEQALEQRLDLDPEIRTYLGMKKDNDKWAPRTEAYASQDLEISETALKALAEIEPKKLSVTERHQREVAIYYFENRVEDYRWRLHRYAVSQKDSPIDDVTALLINNHSIDDVKDAEAYIARVQAVPQVVDEVLAAISVRSELGISPPSFVYPKILENTRALLQGTPFQKNGDAAILLAGFRDKLEGLFLPTDVSNELVGKLKMALKNAYEPALERYIAALETEQEKTDADDGVWKLPQGDAFYRASLRRYTTTKLSPDEIHDKGLSEVERIQNDIRAIMKEVGYAGSLQEFFQYMRTDDRWYYPETEMARDDYLAESVAVIERAEEKVGRYFNLMPKAEVIVKRVEAFREKNTSAAFYNAPPLDGSKPGSYYVPLYRMKDNPRWDLVTTAHHEALPGHHMQIAIARELKGVPLPIRLMSFGAYSEGWALYAEYLALEMGLLEKKPYMNFGRLGGELFRAVRLVVDTGIHSKGWTRQEANDYMVQNLPYTEDYVAGEVDRYIVWPAQATSYKIGMLTILEARRQAEAELGDRFDIRLFHDVILGQGSMPMSILERRVQAWVRQREMVEK